MIQPEFFLRRFQNFWGVWGHASKKLSRSKYLRLAKKLLSLTLPRLEVFSIFLDLLLFSLTAWHIMGINSRLQTDFSYDRKTFLELIKSSQFNKHLFVENEIFTDSLTWLLTAAIHVVTKTKLKILRSSLKL